MCDCVIVLSLLVLDCGSHYALVTLTSMPFGSPLTIDYGPLSNTELLADYGFTVGFSSYLGLYVCMYVCTYVCFYVCIFVNTFMYIKCIRVYVNAYTTIPYIFAL